MSLNSKRKIKMIDFDSYYPCQEDCQLGNIVLETTLELQQVDQKINELMNFLMNLEINEKSDDYEQKIESQTEELSKYFAIKKTIYSKIATSPRLFENIPWQNHSVSVKQGEIPYSENCFTISFKGTSIAPDAIFNEIAEKLIQGMPHCHKNTISFNHLSGITEKVNQILRGNTLNAEEGNGTQVELYASFISLNRTKGYDSLRIREDACLSESMVNNASSVYIVSECLLGGLFLGLQTYTENENGTRNFALSTMSVEQKGTLGKVVLNNLDQSYVNWKNALLNDPNAGYPIAFKVKNLKTLI